MAQNEHAISIDQYSHHCHFIGKQDDAFLVHNAMLRHLSSRLPKLLGDQLSSILGSSDAWIRIRRLPIKLALTRDLVASNQWLYEVNEAIVEAYQRVQSSALTDVLVYPSEQSFKASFIRHLLLGTAWQRWEFEEFKHLQYLSNTEAIHQMLVAGFDQLPALCAALEKEQLIDETIGCQQQYQIVALVEAWAGLDFDPFFSRYASLIEGVQETTLVALVHQVQQVLANRPTNQTVLHACLIAYMTLVAVKEDSGKPRMVQSLDQREAFTVVVCLGMIVSLREEVKAVVDSKAPVELTLAESNIQGLDRQCFTQLLLVMAQFPIVKMHVAKVLSLIYAGAESRGCDNGVVNQQGDLRPDSRNSRSTRRDERGLSGSVSENDSKSNEAQSNFHRIVSENAGIMLLVPVVLSLDLHRTLSEEQLVQLFTMLCQDMDNFDSSSSSQIVGTSERNKNDRAVASISDVNEKDLTQESWLGGVFETVDNNFDSVDESARPSQKSANSDSSRGKIAFASETTSDDLLPARWRLGLSEAQQEGVRALGGLNAIKRLLLAQFAARLSGMQNSSDAYLFKNFLRQPGSIEISSQRIRIRLNPIALRIVLDMAGYSHYESVLPWSQRIFTLDIKD